MVWLEAFGHLIANTDMHMGNLSLFLQGTTLAGLTPVYDMLPMYYAPRHGGELPRGHYNPWSVRERFPLGTQEAAADLWRRVLQRAEVSEGFKEIARQHLAWCRTPKI